MVLRWALSGVTLPSSCTRQFTFTSASFYPAILMGALDLAGQDNQTNSCVREEVSGHNLWWTRIGRVRSSRQNFRLMKS